MTKYLYLNTREGFNDNIVQLINAIDYCKKNNRILLFDYINSIYKINFYDYFSINNTDIDIIYDSNKIRDLSFNNMSIYPSIFKNMNMALNNHFINGLIYKNTPKYGLPNYGLWYKDLCMHFPQNCI